jgi:transcriptional regulator of heat shock response
MPRESKWKRFLKELRSLVNQRLYDKALCEIEQENDDEEDMKDALLADIAQNVNEHGTSIEQGNFSESCVLLDAKAHGTTTK